jgi:two-component system, OmpR family, response regulator RpaA
MAQIMLVDDDKHVVEVVERALRRQGHAVIVASDGREALGFLQRQSPDLLILDVMLPRLNGVQVCEYVRSHPNLASIPILLLTVKEDIKDKVVGFGAGADDYLTKPFNLNELELRVKALLRHSRAAAASKDIVAGLVQIDAETEKVWIDGQPIKLTNVEYQLLHHLALHAGEILSTEQLLQHVWGYPPGTGNPSLVRMHVLNVRRKIEKDPQHPQCLRTVPRHGYTIAP